MLAATCQFKKNAYMFIIFFSGHDHNWEGEWGHCKAPSLVRSYTYLYMAILCGFWL